MTEDEERSRLLAIGRGDRGAMRAFFQDHHPGLIQFIENRVRDRVEAADVAQETFLGVWRQASRFQGRSSVKTWLYSIARNKALDRLRRTRPEEPMSGEFDVEDVSIDVAGATEAASDARRVRDCIAKLSAPQRRTVQLAFYDDLSYAEIAQIERTPEGTVKTRIFHAKRLLMNCLGRDMAPA